MKTTALIERGEDGRFGIFTPDLKSTISGEGESVEKAKEDFLNSYSEILSCYDNKEDVAEELVDLEFVYKYDIASIFNYFDWINVSAFARHAGINPALMHQYKKKETYISDKQMRKIETALHSLGAELCSSLL